MLKWSVAWFAVVIIVSLAIVTAAKASYGDTRLDSLATAIAGKPVQVSCGSDDADWAKTEQGVGYTFNVDGFTYAKGAAIIYLAPRICDTIEADLHQGVGVVGDYWNGLAVKVFIHEATHQALGSSDEGLVECQAFKNVRSFAPLFGYAKTVKTTGYVKQANGSYKRVVKTVPNPAIARLVKWATFWHKLLPASYQAVC